MEIGKIRFANGTLHEIHGYMKQRLDICRIPITSSTPDTRLWRRSELRLRAASLIKAIIIFCLL